MKRAYYIIAQSMENGVRQKPVKNDNKKTLKNQFFQGSELSASKTVVFGDTI